MLLQITPLKFSALCKKQNQRQCYTCESQSQNEPLWLGQSEQTAK